MKLNHIKQLLRPKNATFCPGCPGKLELDKVFNYDIPVPQDANKQPSGQVMTLKKDTKKNNGKLVNSLF